MKLAMIGGGSYAWTPGLVKDMMANEFIEEMDIYLYDINELALEDMISICGLYKKAFKKNGFNIVKTTNLKEALTGASYVTVAVSNGGLGAELEDHKIARKYGYYNMKGSEVGIAGCSRTLRHVPEIVRIAKEMEKYCPNALLLNVTNPLSAITRAVNKYTSIKAVGFCHGVCNHLQILFPLIGAESWEGIDFTVAGVDHCSWLLGVKYKGQDALQILKDKGLIEAAKGGSTIASYDDPFAGVENQRLRFLIWDVIGYLPAISDEHCIEFFGQIMKSKETRDYYGVTYDRIAERTKSVDVDRKNIQAILNGTRELNLYKSSEIIDKIVATLNGGGAFVDVLNYPNEGQIPNLPMGMVVETKCLIDANGIHPIQAGELPPILDSIVRPIGIREELYMEAAMENNIGKLRAGLSTDPLVNDFRNINELCSELMDYNRKYIKNPM